MNHAKPKQPDGDAVPVEDLSAEPVSARCELIRVDAGEMDEDLARLMEAPGEPKRQT